MYAVTARLGNYRKVGVNMTYSVKLFDVADAQGLEDSLLMMAEECAELSKAALKLVRVTKGTTPVTWNQGVDDLAEEIADVQICLRQIEYLLSCEGVKDLTDKVNEVADQKIDRGYNRLVLGKWDK